MDCAKYASLLNKKVALLRQLPAMNSKNMVRNAMKALHIELLTEDRYASPTITAIKTPQGIDLGEF